MDKNLKIEKQVSFPVEKSKVWDALINPEETQKISFWNRSSL